MHKVHDSKIISYQVNFKILKIEMNIETEEKINQFASENKKFLEEGKDYYLPIDYNQTEELTKYLKNNNCRYYKSTIVIRFKWNRYTQINLGWKWINYSCLVVNNE